MEKEQIEKLVDELIKEITARGYFQLAAKAPKRFTKREFGQAVGQEIKRRYGARLKDLKKDVARLEARAASQEAAVEKRSALKYVKAQRAKGNNISIVDELTRRLKFQKRREEAKNPSEIASATAVENCERARAEGKKVTFAEEYRKAMAKLNP